MDKYREQQTLCAEEFDYCAVTKRYDRWTIRGMAKQYVEKRLPTSEIFNSWVLAIAIFWDIFILEKLTCSEHNGGY